MNRVRRRTAAGFFVDDSPGSDTTLCMARIAVIGPGAIGCTMIGWLSQVPAHRVVVCARTAFDQLELQTPAGTLRVRPTVLTSPAQVPAVDWVLVATKTYDATGTVAWLQRLVGPATRVAVLQNGVEHVARFAPQVPADAIVPVVVDCPAERTAPGRVRQRGDGVLTVPASDGGRAFAALFESTPLAVKTTPDWPTAAWRKLCLNAAGAVSAVVLQPARIARDEAIADVMRGIVREVIAVGTREGARLDDALVEWVITSYRNAPPDSINSIHADRLAGRRMEIDARNGVIVRLGRRHGIATPYNEAICAFLSALEPAAAG